MFKSIRLERTMCYGTCPVYSVQVDKYGNVNYYGEAFVYKAGEHQWRISKKKLEQLNNLIVDFEFKSFEYEPGKEVITDQPSCITTVEYQDGKNKEVNHYHGDILINDNLTIFEKKIERILGTKKYVNPRLYIYQVEERAKKELGRIMVVSDSKKEAIETVLKEYDMKEEAEWQVKKIGIAIDDYYGPVILMKDNKL
ncbi:DUF6438 domain-containing protein [Garciella nitratireducens]|uniref:DUF6438 domain-containing protein n=1 Tax=Garciella nitratireducens TaxID=218205 RepID=UPI001BD23FCC|nr:DUF6438 domain-containing protein [Garciella nitratireducens]